MLPVNWLVSIYCNFKAEDLKYKGIQPLICGIFICYRN